MEVYGDEVELSKEKGSEKGKESASAFWTRDQDEEISILILYPSLCSLFLLRIETIITISGIKKNNIWGGKERDIKSKREGYKSKRK